MGKGIILLCAGGTGGHLFPAYAVAQELTSRGYRIHLAVDDRVTRFAANFPCEEIHEIRSATFTSKKPTAILHTLLSLYRGYRQSKRLLRELSPVAVAGFGGYPSVPPLLAAVHCKIPTLIHEANAVLGRANRFLGKRVDHLAIGFDNPMRFDAIEISVTGNPVRSEILEVAALDYPHRNVSDPFNLLIFGGSQGAAFFSTVLPAAMHCLPEDLRGQLRIVQQARPEDIDEVIRAYRELGVTARVEDFFSDMAKQFAQAHLVVARAGASTLSELAIVGRPALLVPYPGSLDHDQAVNAMTISRDGGALTFEQGALTPEILADEIFKAIHDPKKLALAAGNAKNAGRPDAAKTLADIIGKLDSNRYKPENKHHENA